jgi:3-deoxy-D-manno-octulosonic-acid transferase
LMRAAYSLALGLGIALASPILAARMAGGRYREIALARLGLGSNWLPQVRPGGIWLHALSVGEVKSALPLLTVLGERFPHLPRYLSVATAQGYAIAAESLDADEDVRLFVRPLDLPWAVRRLLDRLKPKLFCLVEGDIWPNWQWGLGARGVPRLLVNGRVSPRTYRGYRRLGTLARALWDGFDRVLVQTKVDYERLRKVGVSPERLSVGGNLKFDSAPARLSQSDRESLAEELGLQGRRVLIAGSTHASEEDPCLDAYAALKDEHPDLSLIIAPREIDRGETVAQLARARGLSAARVSRGAPPKGSQVVVLDVLGRLAQTYALASASFVGGSLVQVGGHNLLEPAAQGVPVVFGPITHNFLEMAKELQASGGGVRIAKGRELAKEWGIFLREPARAKAMGEAGLQFCRSHRGALKRALHEAEALLERA